MNIITFRQVMQDLHTEVSDDGDREWGLVHLDTVKEVTNIKGKAFGGLLSVLSLWGGGYIKVDGKVGWISL